MTKSKMASEDQGSRTIQSSDLAKSNTGDIEVPPKEWESFLDSFSLQHEGWLISLSTVYESKASSEIGNCRFQRIAIDCAAEKRYLNISFMAGQKPGTYAVPDPLHLTFKRDTAGAHQGLEISSSDGSVTALRFRVAAHPESLDGVLPSLTAGH